MTFTLHNPNETKPYLNGLHSKSKFDKVGILNGKPSVEAEGFLYEKTSDSVRTNSKDGRRDIPIIAQSPNLYKQTGDFVSKRFLKLNPCEATLWLMAKHPNAYLLLNLVAIRAERIPNHPSGLEVGESLIGDYDAIGATRGEYRAALKVLVRMKYLTISETCRNRKKATTGTTTVGTKVKLLSSDIWDINIEEDNHRINHRATTEQPPSNHDQEGLDKIDDDLIDLGKSDFDPKTTLRFKHKKTGVVEISIEELKSDLISEGWISQEIYQAIAKMKSFDPEISGTIKKYITTILINDRSNQKKEQKCPKTPKQTQQKNNPSKTECPKDKGYYTADDIQESPLAKLSRRTGLK